MKRTLIALALLAAPAPVFANGMQTKANYRVQEWCTAPDESYPNENFSLGRQFRWGPCWAWR